MNELFTHCGEKERGEMKTFLIDLIVMRLIITFFLSGFVPVMWESVALSKQEATERGIWFEPKENAKKNPF